MPKYAIRTAIVVGSGVAGWLHTSGVFDDDPVALPPPAAVAKALPPPEVAAAALPQTVVMEEPVAPSLADAATADATGADAAAESWAVEVNLGEYGEPKGRTTVNFKPTLQDSGKPPTHSTRADGDTQPRCSTYTYRSPTAAFRVCVCVCGVAELIQLDLRLPLGMLIEVEDAEGGGSIAGQWYQKTNVIITDALPGYSAYGNVQKGDVS